MLNWAAWAGIAQRGGLCQSAYHTGEREASNDRMQLKLERPRSLAPGELCQQFKSVLRFSGMQYSRDNDQECRDARSTKRAEPIAAQTSTALLHCMRILRISALIAATLDELYEVLSLV